MKIIYRVALFMMLDLWTKKMGDRNKWSIICSFIGKKKKIIFWKNWELMRILINNVQELYILSIVSRVVLLIAILKEKLPIIFEIFALITQAYLIIIKRSWIIIKYKQGNDKSELNWNPRRIFIWNWHNCTLKWLEEYILGQNKKYHSTFNIHNHGHYHLESKHEVLRNSKELAS